MHLKTEATSPRLIGYDIARALAVFGMVFVNFKMVMGATGRGPVWLDFCSNFLMGKAAATFVVLAGVGVSLLTRKARQSHDVQLHRQARQRLGKRAVFLLLVGLAYTSIWPGDILRYYGVYLAIASLLLRYRPLVWCVLAVAVNVAFLGLLVVFDYEQGWDWATLQYDGFWSFDGFVRYMFFNGFHPVFPWIGFLWLGMWLGTLDLRQGGVRGALFCTGGAMLTMGTLVSQALVWWGRRYLDWPLEDVIAVFGTEPMPPLPLYMFVGVGTALCVITASVQLGLWFADRWWIQWLVATGQLSLTLYVAHVIVGMGVLDAMGWLENQSLVFSLSYAWGFMVVAMVFAWLWRKRFERGPLEWVMRRVIFDR